MLETEEYIEQAYFFRTLAERMAQNIPAQEVLALVKEEVLTTTKLPMAVDYMLSELRHCGQFGSAMRHLSHYFTAFQAYLVAQSERETGHFDLRVALAILATEADYRARGATPQGVFLYQFEAISRNRLGYDDALVAIGGDSIFGEDWKSWILALRRQVDVVDLADLIYVNSDYYEVVKARQLGAHQPSSIDSQDSRQKLFAERLFGEREGRIALANRHKDPLLLFSALHRQLSYPQVPAPSPIDQTSEVLTVIQRRMERMETRMKLLEEELRGGIDLSRFFERPRGDAGNRG